MQHTRRSCDVQQQLTPYRFQCGAGTRECGEDDRRINRLRHGGGGERVALLNLPVGKFPQTEHGLARLIIRMPRLRSSTDIRRPRIGRAGASCDDRGGELQTWTPATSTIRELP